jgi:hypothetical protein
MSGESDVRELVDLYRALGDVLTAIQEAIMAADTEKLSELVPLQEELMRRTTHIQLPAEVSPELGRELREAAEEAVRRNTTNAVLLSEQLALIQETMKAIIGEQRAINRLA